MREWFVTFVIVSGCAPASSPGDCPPRVEAPAPTTTAVGTSVDLQVRFVNGRAGEVPVTGLALSSEALSFGTDARELTLPPGSCPAPSERLVSLRFSPTRPGRQVERLLGFLGDAPLDVVLDLTATGPLFDAPDALSFGVIGRWPSGERTLEVRNVGTADTSLEVRVESVRPVSAATSAEELCLGTFDGSRCSATGPVSIRRSERLPLRVLPRSPGSKTWDVDLVAGGQRRTVRVVASVVDTSGCVLRAPPSVDFGLPVPPARARRTIRIENTGTSPCVVQSARTNDPRFALPGPPTNLVLAPGEVSSVEVELTLTQVRSATATLRLQLIPREENAQASVDVRLEAMSAPSSCLGISPLDIDFGSTPGRCGASRRRITLTNTCERPVVLTSSEVLGEPFVVFGLLAPNAILPRTSWSVDVAVAPSDLLGTESGAVRLTLEDGSQLVVSLFVRLEPGPIQIDTFAFERRPQADLVFVLDDSPSFVRHHPHVRAELDRVATRLSWTDARVAVTTMGQGQFRALDGGLRWTPLRTASDRENFRALTELTSTGAEGQSCLEAAVRSITPPLSTDAMRNGGFRRGGEWLALICITDDAERSSMPDIWRQQLGQLDAGVLTYSVLGPFGSRCQVEAPDLDGGHEASVRAFHGLSEDVCGPWASSFGGDVWGHRTVFFLNATPRPESLVVRLDGLVLEPTNAMGVEQWRYDSAANSVRLSVDLVERDPRQMTITYEKACY